MKADLRETLGKAAYEHAPHKTFPFAWKNISEQEKELYRQVAEDVVLALGQVMVPQLQYVAMVLTDRPVEITLGEATAAWPKNDTEGKMV